MADTELQGKIVIHADTGPAEAEIQQNAKKMAEPISDATKNAFQDGIKKVSNISPSNSGTGTGNTLGAGKTGKTFIESIGESLKGTGKNAIEGIGGKAGPAGSAVAKGVTSSISSGAAIGVGAVAAVAAGLAVVGLAAKSLTEKLLNFGRSLAEVSGKMALAFNKFDIQMALLKKKIGDDLAPAFSVLLNHISKVARDSLPALESALRACVSAADGFVSGLEWLITGGPYGPSPEERRKQVAINEKSIMRFRKELDDPNILPERIKQLKEIIQKLIKVDEDLLGKADDDLSMQLMSGFSNAILDSHSAQSKYNNRLKVTGTQLRGGYETNHTMFGANFSIGADDSAHWTMTGKGKNASNRFSQ